MILALTVVAYLLTGPSSRIPPYSLDGAGKSIRLYVGTYLGYQNGRVVERWEIDVIGGRVYATDIVPGVARDCMIAEPVKDESSEGLFFVHGTPFVYTYEYGGLFFGVDDMPVLALEAGGLVVKTNYEGGIPSTTEHIKRISTHPNHKDMYGLRDGVHESCLPDPQPNSIYWLAFSKSAYSITGNVKFTPTRMMFGNGKSITIQYLGTHPVVASQAFEQRTARFYSVYRVTTSANPTLLNGNKMCGWNAPAVTYLTIAYEVDSSSKGSMVDVAEYTGRSAPALYEHSPTFCGEDFYTVKR